MYRRSYLLWSSAIGRIYKSAFTAYQGGYIVLRGTLIDNKEPSNTRKPIYSSSFTKHSSSSDHDLSPPPAPVDKKSSIQTRVRSIGFVITVRVYKAVLSAILVTLAVLILCSNISDIP